MVQFLVHALWLLVAAKAMRDQWESYDHLVIMLVQAVEASNHHGSHSRDAKTSADASRSSSQGVERSPGDRTRGRSVSIQQQMTTGYELCESLYEHALAEAPRTTLDRVVGKLCLSRAAWALPQVTLPSHVPSIRPLAPSCGRVDQRKWS